MPCITNHKPLYIGSAIQFSVIRFTDLHFSLIETDLHLMIIIIIIIISISSSSSSNSCISSSSSKSSSRRINSRSNSSGIIIF